VYTGLLHEKVSPCLLFIFKMSGFFIDPKDLPQDGYGLIQVLFLGAVYGYVLFNASNMISDGSELLLLVPCKIVDLIPAFYFVLIE
jgi:hypothetical protein